MHDESNNPILAQSIIGTLLYYDLFNYPLKSEEVFRFVNTKHVNEKDVENELHHLKRRGFVFEYENFFSLQNEESLITRRKKGNNEAGKYLELAKNKALQIMCFPFVRAVLVSGSLSKNYIDEESDIDFFIVTTPGKLWATRFILSMYKKIFLRNSHKHFCLNYFIDTDHLEIEEKNIFTATELATAIPLEGKMYYEKLMHSNLWLRKIFPNYQPRSVEEMPERAMNSTKKIMETLINVVGYRWMDYSLMKLFLVRSKMKHQSKYTKVDFKVAFKTKPQVSKNHPKNYQKRILESYEKKLVEIKSRFSFE